MSMLFCPVDSSCRKARLNASVSSATPSPRAPKSFTLIGTDEAAKAPAPEADDLAGSPLTPIKVPPDRKEYEIRNNETSWWGNGELTLMTIRPLTVIFHFLVPHDVVSAA